MSLIFTIFLSNTLCPCALLLFFNESVCGFVTFLEWFYSSDCKNDGFTVPFFSSCLQISSLNVIQDAKLLKN